MGTKLGKVVTYHEELPLISYVIPQSRGFVRSPDVLNLYISTSTRPMATKHGKRGGDSPWGASNQNSYYPLNICSWEVTQKIKTSPPKQCLSQVFQGGATPQGAPTYKYAWPLSEVVMWGHVTN